MGIRVGRFWVIYESVSGNAIDPEFLNISEEKMRKYLKENPMPKDPEYSPEDLIGDITNSSGFYSLPDNTKEETRDHVVELLNTLYLGKKKSV